MLQISCKSTKEIRKHEKYIYYTNFTSKYYYLKNGLTFITRKYNDLFFQQLREHPKSIQIDLN